jgi:lactobin A/cerein 7B family class IIb bacteriocin
MKKEARKLNLNRETLAPMQQQELQHVNGGVTPATTVTTSSAACISAASAVGSAIVHTVGMAFESRWCGGKK